MANYPFQIPSGVNLIPEASGINQLGNSDYPFIGGYVKSLYTSVKTVTGSVTLTNLDHVILCNQSSAMQITMPVTSQGKQYTIIDISNSALTNPITLSGLGCNINGGLTSSINVSRSMTTVFSDGVNYYKGTTVI